MEWLSRAWGIVVDVWTFELIQFEGESLSAGRLISATALIVLGVLFARRTASFVGKRLLPPILWKISDAACRKAGYLRTLDQIGFCVRREYPPLEHGELRRHTIFPQNCKGIRLFSGCATDAPQR